MQQLTYNSCYTTVHHSCFKAATQLQAAAPVQLHATAAIQLYSNSCYASVYLKVLERLINKVSYISVQNCLIDTAQQRNGVASQANIARSIMKLLLCEARSIMQRFLHYSKFTVNRRALHTVKPCTS